MNWKIGLIGTISGVLLGSSTTAVAATAVTETAVTEAKTWSYSQERNPISGGTIFQAQADMTDVRVSVRCSTVDPTIEIRFFLNRDELDQVAGVRWQFDQTPSKPDRWARSANGRSLIVPGRSKDRFLHLLRAYNKLSLTIVGTGGNETAFEIPLSGSSAAISRVTDRCR